MDKKYVVNLKGKDRDALGRYLPSQVPVLTVEPSERFQSFATRIEGGCWVWEGYCFKKSGYGKFTVGGYAETYAHRWSYLFYVGEIPEGREVDHLCRNRRCVNPKHLEAVPHKINVGRGEAGVATGAKNLAKTHCPNGHPYDEANTYHHPRGHRQCRACVREATMRLYWAKREA